MASPKSVVVLSILLANIHLLSLHVDATRELTEQTHDKASKVPEEEEKMSFGFFVGNNNDNGGTNPGMGGYQPGNGYPVNGGYQPGNGYPVNGGYLPGNGYFGYGDNPGGTFFGGGPGQTGGSGYFPYFPRGLGRQYPGYGAYAGNP